MRYYPLLSLFLLTLLVATACEKDPAKEWDNAVILSIDQRDCVCCGGFFIEVGNETLRSFTLPAEFAASFDVKELPLDVRMRWREAVPHCMGDEIEIIEIERL